MKRFATVLSVLCLLAACDGKMSASSDAGAQPPPPPCSTCTESEVCLRDRCLPRQCSMERCGTHQACFAGRCRDVACDGITCPSSTACAGGMCHPLMCEGGEPCPTGEVCVDTACVPVDCVGVTCPDATTCVEGLCLPRECAGEICPSGEFCLDGSCTEEDCLKKVCPGGTFCYGGRCSTCEPGTWPADDGGPCMPVNPNGASCTAGYQCTSSACVEATCCNSACVEACTSCDGGTCTPLTAGTVDVRCGNYRCLGDGTCAGTCDADAACAPGSRCVAEACVPRAVNGAPCTGNAECMSDVCVDGTCCASTCGACGTCNAPESKGTCVPRPAGTSCRASASSCDAEERCDGTSPECPADSAKPDGTSCRADAVGAWSTCALPSTCSGSGIRTRDITGFTCQAGACTGVERTETETCTTNTSGSPCGTPTYGSWSPCSFSSTCDETGTRTRSVTRYSCSGSTCANPQTTTETGTCTRDTDGTGCGTTTYGTWSTCNYASDCDESASDRTRSVTTLTCRTGACTSTTTTQRSACTRNTDGSPCAPFSYGTWSTCGSFSSTCDESGSQTRSVTGKKCSGGFCANYSGTDSRSCTRDTDGNSCGRTGCSDKCSGGACVYRCLSKVGCNYC